MKKKGFERIMVELVYSLVVESYFLILVLFCAAEVMCLKWHLPNGMKTLILQRHVCPFVQKPLANTSASASLDTIEVGLLNVALKSVVNIGLMVTLVQFFSKISAVILRISLCLNSETTLRTR